MANESREKSNALGVSVSTIFIVLAIITIVVAVIFWGISLTRKYQLSSAEKKLDDVNQEMTTYSDIDEKAKAISAILENVGSVDAGKNYWSFFLRDVAERTTKNTQFVQFSMDEDNIISVSGLTSSYEALAKLMTSLRGSERFTDVILDTATLSTEGGGAPINFVITLTPSGDAFVGQEEEAASGAEAAE